jgi:hypothetical protein
VTEALYELQSTWRAARQKFIIKSSILSGNINEAPDAAHVKIGGDFPLSTAALDIKTATVPRAMIVTLLTVLRLPARTVGRCPLRRQIPLCDGQRSGQPQHDAAAAQCPRDVLSRLRQHDRFGTVIPAAF